MDYKDVTPNELERFIANNRDKAKTILSVLGKNRQFLNAVQSPIGQELLNDGIQRMQVLLEKIVNEDADEKDKAEFRCYREITTSWADKIFQHQKAIEEIKNA